jgi:cellulose synthase/poly-beta-1,6-N-acetylglucosamine synthase-like glycosyltransferase
MAIRKAFVMVQLVKILNLLIFILFFCFYAYQFGYVLVRFFKKMPEIDAKKLHKYAVLIAARNESAVIGELLESIKAQNYPRELVDIYVVADNCTDDTAEIAHRNGATVIERSNLCRIGKGYALNYAFRHIKNTCGIEFYDGYIVFDADNILHPDFIKEINAVFDSGYRVVTSYRNSKNYGYNWISAGYALWFLRESKYLNGARMLCNSSCAISGTGFLVSSEIIKKDGGWNYSLLTEDIEFTIAKVIEGEVIGYAEKAITYDEQPVKFKPSWDQRMRWTKGFYQVMYRYGLKLFRGCFSKNGFRCYDMLATIAPATLLSISMLIVNITSVLYGLNMGYPELIETALLEVWYAFRNIYLSLFFFGCVTLVTEWKQIYCSALKKVLYAFTFPIFMFTYLPIAVAAIFKYKRVTWKPIKHSFVGTMSLARR